MINGLKLTITGDELRSLLQERVNEHRVAEKRWRDELARPAPARVDLANLADDVGDDELTALAEAGIQFPDHMCEYEADRHEWRAEVLEFIREHLEPLEVYRLDEDDLEFGELLPSRPGAVEQQEFEERTRVGFSLERIAKRVNFCPEVIQIMRPE